MLISTLGCVIIAAYNAKYHTESQEGSVMFFEYGPDMASVGTEELGLTSSVVLDVFIKAGYILDETLGNRVVKYCPEFRKITTTTDDALTYFMRNSYEFVNGKILDNHGMYTVQRRRWHGIKKNIRLHFNYLTAKEKLQTLRTVITTNMEKVASWQAMRAEDRDRYYATGQDPKKVAACLERWSKSKVYLYSPGCGASILYRAIRDNHVGLTGPNSCANKYRGQKVSIEVAEGIKFWFTSSTLTLLKGRIITVPVYFDGKGMLLSSSDWSHGKYYVESTNPKLGVPLSQSVGYKDLEKFYATSGAEHKYLHPGRTLYVAGKHHNTLSNGASIELR